MRANAILNLVRRLLTHEAAESPEHDAQIEATERVCDKLRVHLSKRIGKEGFRTLLARALTVTTSDFPHLNAVRVAEDGSLIGLRRTADLVSHEDQAQENRAKTDSVEGAVAFVALFLALLITFIGEDITLRMLSTIWPDFPINAPIDSEKERP